MIRTDQELQVTRERVSYLLDLLVRLRVSSRPEELALVSGGYRADVERIQPKELDYLTQPAPPTAKAVSSDSDAEVSHHESLCVAARSFPGRWRRRCQVYRSCSLA